MLDILLIFILSILVGLIGFVLGGGFGTILTPILILLGFDPLSAIFLVLVAQFFGEAVATVLHHRVGNANFNHNSVDSKFGVVLGVSGVVSLVGVFIALSIDKLLLINYNAIILVVLGIIVILARGSTENRLSMNKVVIIGSVASINKALTGGNYGPTILAGSLIFGGDIKKTIAIISLAETIACGVAVIGYVMSGIFVPLEVLLSAILGTTLATIPSVLFVKKTSNGKLKKIIGLLMVSLGIVLMLKFA